jgi:hypothetical protein
MRETVNLDLQLHQHEPGNDPGEQLLDLCAQWRMARAEQEVNWAEHNWASLLAGSSNERTQVRTEPLNRMCVLQDALARLGEPHTLLGARELLGIALKLLACRIEHPESAVAERPVLQLIQNVNEALKWLDGETRLCASSRSDKTEPGSKAPTDRAGSFDDRFSLDWPRPRVASTG